MELVRAHWSAVASLAGLDFSVRRVSLFPWIPEFQYTFEMTFLKFVQTILRKSYSASNSAPIILVTHCI